MTPAAKYNACGYSFDLILSKKIALNFRKPD